MISDNLLLSFMDNFFGYGNLDGPIWFIGMEEGGGGSPTEIAARLNAWDKRGRKLIEDVAEYHIEFGATKLFNSNDAPIQRTWGKLIRSTLVGLGTIASKSEIQSYQSNHWGRHSGQTCLLELMPLPSPNTNEWQYCQISKLDVLKDRATYFSALREPRANKIRQLIKLHSPKVVVFYGKSYEKIWFEICDYPMVWTDFTFGRVTLIDRTYFVSISHPASRGIRNEQFDELGHFIKSKISTLE